MKENAIISHLRAKYAEKTWNETFQLVRRCMEKSRDESTPCEPLVRSLERLQEAFNMSSTSAMRSRLENTAKRQGMGFHTSEHTCYLTSDLFYLEVVLQQQQGEVEDVKVATHGGIPVSSESFLQLLRSKNFAEFSNKLASLHAQYNFPGDNETKLKVFAALQCLGKDLAEISQLPRVPVDSSSQMDVISHGLIGRLIAGKEDCPLTIEFSESPAEDKSQSLESFTQRAQVAVAESCTPRQLQKASTILKPLQLDPHGLPVFLPMTEVPHEILPARFLLKLQPPVPMLRFSVEKIHQITDALADLDLRSAPFPSLLRRGHLGSTAQEDTEERDSVFSTLLPCGTTHRYVFPGAVWEMPSKRGTMMESVPFSLPSHVPPVVKLLRHQCFINALLRSCTCPVAVSAPDLHFEVFLESDTSFSVTFHSPDTDSLAVLLVSVPDDHHISCRLFGTREQDLSLEEHLSSMMSRSMSVPLTLQALYVKLAARAPVSPICSTAAQIPNRPSDLSGTSVTDTNSVSTTAARSAAVPRDCPAPGSCSKSVLVPEINAADTPALPPPLPPLGVLPLWISSNDQLPQLL
ncbi:mediator of RNA polymerase II transcription subunit 1-like isoform X2 [Synchiropus splendidus]|nr:mediator of RNA polymerase II transcription subunit 1-like isoform X2 [Synchiropus splendidus]